MHRPAVFSLKVYSPDAPPPALLTYLEREPFLCSFGVGTVMLRGVSPDVLTQVAQLGGYYDTVDEPTLRTAIQRCRPWQRLEERGFVDELGGRYTHLKRYFLTFLTLPFAGALGMQPLAHCHGPGTRHWQAGGVPALPA